MHQGYFRDLAKHINVQCLKKEKRVVGENHILITENGNSVYYLIGYSKTIQMLCLPKKSEIK